MTSSASGGPLTGVRVIDASSIVFGPFASQMLADLGAEVIKIENPHRGGEVMRHAGESPAPGFGPIFMALNRNKRSVALDLAAPAGTRAFSALLESADVFFHNVRLAGMERLGFGYESVRALREDIIYVHCAGYGADGPYAPRQALDDLVQGAVGFADLATIRDGGPPQYAPSIVADKSAGLYAFGATLAALYHRERTGEGQFVSVPMFEAFTHFHMVENLYGQTYPAIDGPMGYARTVSPFRKPYATADGYICIVPYLDEQWLRFFELGGRPELATDPRFAEHGARTVNTDALYAIVEEIAATRTTEEWVQILGEAQIPAMRANSNAAVLKDPHLQAVGMFAEREHPQAGTYRSVRSPYAFSATPTTLGGHPQALGADTRAVLEDLGLAAADVDALCAALPSEGSGDADCDADGDADANGDADGAQ